MKKAFLIVIVICCFFPSIAQEKSSEKTKVYQTWIKLNNNPQRVKGILSEIGDSSFFVAGMHDLSDVQEYRFQDVEMLKVRREKNISRGLVKGTLVGIGSGLVIGSTLGETFGVYSGIVSVYFGITYGALGLATGTLIGTMKDRFPIRNNFVNLEKYRGTLQDYSLAKEKITAVPPFEHRGFVEFSVGWSVAKGEFTSQAPVSNYGGMKMTGSSSKSAYGYWFTKGLGIKFAIRTDQYEVEDPQRQIQWTLDAFTLGPIISMPIVKKLRFNLTPSVGFASAYVWLNEEEVYTGEGFGMNITGALDYRLSKRINASLSAGYLSSRQTYEQGGSGNARDLDFQLGMAYKFGRRSL